MSDDALAVIRRAWHSGDGVAMVAAVERVGAHVCLQWTGDLIFAAVRLRAPGAVELGDGVCAALRQRRWDGDTELADALDSVRTKLPSALTELPVDLEELAILLDAGGDPATGGRLDLQTGQVWPAAVLDDDGWTGSEDELDDEERWLGVWPLGSGAAYRDMADFAATRAGRLHDLLDVALDGRGAFRRFKDVLFEWPHDRAEWFVYSEDRSRGRARAWLAETGYRPLPPLR